jgi:hypothetical protein
MTNLRNVKEEKAGKRNALVSRDAKAADPENWSTIDNERRSTMRVHVAH